MSEVFERKADYVILTTSSDFVCLTDYSLQMVVIRLCRNFRDCFVGVLVFVITKTKTPKYTVKFDLKLGGKDRT